MTHNIEISYCPGLFTRHVMHFHSSYLVLNISGRSPLAHSICILSLQFNLDVKERK